MLSTLKNNVVDADTVRATLVRASALKLPPAGVELQHQGLLHETSPLGHFDNFLVRTLNGEAVFSGVPVGALTRKHVDHAAVAWALFEMLTEEQSKITMKK